MELNRSVVYLAQYHHLFPQFEINFSAKNVDPLLTNFICGKGPADVC